MRIGIDIGGTFTDFVVLGPRLQIFKVLSTPEAPERAVLEGLAQLAGSTAAEITHGTTVGTNAVLERKGARTAFVATAGFRDLLQIGRQNRSSLYDLFADRPAPLIPRERSWEVAERLDRSGQVLQPLQHEEVQRVRHALQESGAESIAICLLYSFLAPAHEQQLAEALSDLGVPVSISSQVRPEFREYERASATALDAYLAPRISAYLGRLEASLPKAHLRIMQSNGGSVSPTQARRRPVRSLLSGPAAGVIGARFVARASGAASAITFDMGGTSTDVSLVEGDPQLTSEARIDGLPIGIPVMDVHTVGAGGGSIAWVDAGGALRVGPRSAGADPGPACYGRRGQDPTVTDAHVVLGRLPADTFRAGGVRLDHAAAEGAMSRLAETLGLSARPDVSAAQQAAQGVLDVAHAHMARALRVISLERGHDPADYWMIAFGGAAGLHACELAREVGVRRVLVPASASALSALGMLAAEAVFPVVQSVLLPETNDLRSLADRFEPLEASARRDLQEEGIDASRQAVTRWLDLRYRGQSFELTVPFGSGFRSAFDALHAKTYGYSDSDWPLEIVNLRVLATGSREPFALPAVEITAEPRPPTVVNVWLSGRRVEAPLFLDPLPHAQTLAGPAIVAIADSTVLLGEADRARVDEFSNLHIEVG